jgi:hypothetical protein
VVIRAFVIKDDLAIRAEEILGCDPSQSAMRGHGVGIARALIGIGLVMLGHRFVSVPPVPSRRGRMRKFVTMGSRSIIDRNSQEM